MMLVSLVGEQVIPVILPILHLRPDYVLLAATERTQPIARRLERIFPDRTISATIPAYDIPEIHAALNALLQEPKAEWGKVVFNLTSGTKPMAIAAHQVARERGDSWIYLQSLRTGSLLYRHQPDSDLNPYMTEEIPSLLTLDLFLRAHLGTYESKGCQQAAEELIVATLSAYVNECKTSVTHGGALEIDLVLRCGNQVGIAEVKTGKKARSKSGIDQLTTAAEQRYLGTFTRKFLMLDRRLGSNNRELALAHRIVIIELPSLQTGQLTVDDRDLLLQAVLPSLGCDPRKER